MSSERNDRTKLQTLETSQLGAVSRFAQFSTEGDGWAERSLVAQRNINQVGCIQTSVLSSWTILVYYIENQNLIRTGPPFGLSEQPASVYPDITFFSSLKPASARTRYLNGA